MRVQIRGSGPSFRAEHNHRVFSSRDRVHVYVCNSGGGGVHVCVCVGRGVLKLIQICVNTRDQILECVPLVPGAPD